jgi:hypothetical protein
MPSDDANCLVCKRTSAEIPLISFRYQNSDLFICPQHLPILIHDPTKLAEVLPGAGGFEPAGHND